MFIATHQDSKISLRTQGLPPPPNKWESQNRMTSAGIREGQGPRAEQRLET